MKFEAKVDVNGVERLIDIQIPADISNTTNSFDAYASGYSRAFNDLVHEMVNTFNYGANNVNTIVRKLNDIHRAKLDEVSERQL